MLKVTYLESDLYLEHLPETLEDWITLRVILALRVGQRLVVERSAATLLLPIDLVKRSSLAAVVAQAEGLLLSQVDADYMEISLQGTWLSSQGQEAEGVFVAALHPAVEMLLLKLWQAAQVSASSVWR